MVKETIYDGEDRARELNMGDYKTMIQRFSIDRGVPWGGKVCKGPPVRAFVNFSRWLAQCDVCGEKFYVSKTYRFFYCFGCGNGKFNGLARPVLFPENCKKIETELLKRPLGIPDEMYVYSNLPATQIAMTARTKTPRCWKHGQTLDDLKRENKERSIK